MSVFVIVIAEEASHRQTYAGPDVVGPFADVGLAETWLVEHDDMRTPDLTIDIVELIEPERYGA